jgi:RHS repeat-associated protein
VDGTSGSETFGQVLERYLYDPYGKVTFLKADWSLQEGEVHADGTASAYANELLFTGHRLDPESGLYITLHRHYHPTLGRWMQRDPQGYVDGMGLYEYCGSRPLIMVDPFGDTITLRVVTKEHDGLSVSPGQIPTSVKQVQDANKDNLRNNYVGETVDRLRKLAPGCRVTVGVACHPQTGEFLKDSKGDIIFKIDVEPTSKGASKAGDRLLLELANSPRDVQIIYEPKQCRSINYKDPVTGGPSIRFDPNYVSDDYVQYQNTATRQYYWGRVTGDAAALGHELIHQYYTEHPQFIKPGYSTEQVLVPTPGGGKQQVTPKGEFANEEKAVVGRPDRTEGDAARPGAVRTGNQFQHTGRQVAPVITENALRETVTPSVRRVSYGAYSEQWLQGQGIVPKQPY